MQDAARVEKDSTPPDEKAGPEIVNSEADSNGQLSHVTLWTRCPWSRPRRRSFGHNWSTVAKVVPGITNFEEVSQVSGHGPNAHESVVWMPYVPRGETRPTQSLAWMP